MEARPIRGHPGGIGFAIWGHRVLTEQACRSAKPRDRDWKLADSGGLFMLVKKSGFKSWRLKYRFGGKEKQLTFGPYPAVSLREARDHRDEAKRALRQGVDPGEAQRRIRERRTSGPRGS